MKKLPTHSSGLLIAWSFALLSRIIAAQTHSHWFHADEWCQTFEPANFLAHGFGMHSQEIGLHMRNLSWASLLAAVLKFSEWIAPGSVEFRVFSIGLFCGLLDLIIFWGWWQVLNHDPLTQRISKSLKNWSLAILLLPWFTVYQSVSPRAEHLSEISLWLTLGLLARQSWALSGISSVAIFAFRYPSGLFSAAVAIYILLVSLKTRNFRAIFRWSLGCLAGALIFGLSDWIYYGRPWESLWMYLQYNIFTQSAVKVFGHQSIAVYTEFFEWNWLRFPLMAPLGATLLISGIIGLGAGLKRLQPWAICLILYGIGHMITPHKEGRFILPVETLIRWAGFVGILFLIKKSVSFPQWLKLSLRAGLVITLVGNVFFFLYALRADFWKPQGTIKEVSEHLSSESVVCAVLTPVALPTLLTPWTSAENPPNPSVGNYYPDPENPEKRKLIWIEHKPSCRPEEKVLVHLEKTTPDLTGCKRLASGILKWARTENWDFFLKNHLASGGWLSCPASVLREIASKETVENRYFRSFGRIHQLPGLGTTAQELERLGRRTSPPPKGMYTPGLLPE